MKAIVVALGEQLGWTVDYEDPPHSKNSADVSDLTDPTWKKAHPSNLFFGLNAGSFTTHLAVPETESISPSPQTVERIVTEYNQTAVPGRFAVRTGDRGRDAIVGVAARNVTGQYENTPVLLDIPIELPASKIGLFDAVSAFTSALTKASGRRVVVGMIPINLFNQVECVPPSEKMSSRALIGRLLDSAPVKLGYLLLYDPNDDFYVLSVRQLTRVSITSHGEEKFAVPQQK